MSATAELTILEIFIEHEIVFAPQPLELLFGQRGKALDNTVHILERFCIDFHLPLAVLLSPLTSGHLVDHSLGCPLAFL